MKLWDFAHGLFFIARNLHLYEFLGLAFAAVMAAALIVHFVGEKKRKDKHEDNLRTIESGGRGTGKKHERSDKV